MIPLIPVVSAILAGGSLVPHAAGGLIVASAASSYVAGTYISTAALASFLTGAAVTAGVGATAAVAGGFAASRTYIAGLFAAPAAAAAPAAIPFIVPLLGAATVMTVGGAGYATYKYFALVRKLKAAKKGEEVVFTKREAKLVERLLLKNRSSSDTDGECT